MACQSKAGEAVKASVPFEHLPNLAGSASLSTSSTSTSSSLSMTFVLRLLRAVVPPMWLLLCSLGGQDHRSCRVKSPSCLRWRQAFSGLFAWQSWPSASAAFSVTCVASVASVAFVGASCTSLVVAIAVVAITAVFVVVVTVRATLIALSGSRS